MLRRLFIALVLVMAASAFGQSFAPRWQRLRDSALAGREYVDGIDVDSAGNPVAVDAVPTESADRALAIVKRDRSGKKLWSRILGQKGWTVGWAYNGPNKIFVDRSDDSVTVVTNAVNNATGRPFPRIYRLDKEGKTLWRLQLKDIFDNRVNFEAFVDAALGDQGELTVVGQSTRSDITYGGSFITRISPDGQVAWQRVYTVGTCDSMFRRVALDRKGNAYCGAWAFNCGYDTEAYAVAYDPDGSLLYSTKVHIPQHTSAITWDLVVDSSGAATQVGYAYSAQGDVDAFAAQVDAGGTQTFGLFFAGRAGYTDLFFGATIDGRDNVYMGGTVIDNFDTGFDGLIVVLDPQGNVIADHRYVGVGFGTDVFEELHIDASGALHAIGNGSARFEDRGEALWCRWQHPLNSREPATATYAYGGPHPSRFYHMAINDYGEVFVAGSVGKLDNESALTVCLAQAPVARNDRYATSVNSPLTIGIPGVLANDAWTWDSTAYAVDAFGAGYGVTKMGGTYRIASDGRLRYTPPKDFVGVDAMAYTLRRGDLVSPTVGLIVVEVRP